MDHARSTQLMDAGSCEENVLATPVAFRAGPPRRVTDCGAPVRPGYAAAALADRTRLRSRVSCPGVSGRQALLHRQAAGLRKTQCPASLRRRACAAPPRPITASHEDAGRTSTVPACANGAMNPSTRSRLSASTIRYRVCASLTTASAWMVTPWPEAFSEDRCWSSIEPIWGSAAGHRSAWCWCSATKSAIPEPPGGATLTRPGVGGVPGFGSYERDPVGPSHVVARAYRELPPFCLAGSCCTGGGSASGARRVPPVPVFHAGGATRA